MIFKYNLAVYAHIRLRNTEIRLAVGLHNTVSACTSVAFFLFLETPSISDPGGEESGGQPQDQEEARRLLREEGQGAGERPQVRRERESACFGKD